MHRTAPAVEQVIEPPRQTRLCHRGHFAMVVAVQAHPGALALSRWVDADADPPTDLGHNTPGNRQVPLTAVAGG
ncbi:MAG: hypothetical protein ABI692_12255 [Terracoccus sp.]